MIASGMRVFATSSSIPAAPCRATWCTASIALLPRHGIRRSFQCGLPSTSTSACAASFGGFGGAKAQGEAGSDGLWRRRLHGSGGCSAVASSTRLSQIRTGRGGRGRFDLSQELSLYVFERDGSYDETVMTLGSILATLGLPVSTSFLRQVRATQIPKLLFWPGRSEDSGGAILLTLGHQRALLNHERVLLFGVGKPEVEDFAKRLSVTLQRGHGAGPHLEAQCPELRPAELRGAGMPNEKVAEALRQKLAEADVLPFEMRALEAMLANVADTHESRLEVLAPVILAMLKNINESSTVPSPLFSQHAAVFREEEEEEEEEEEATLKDRGLPYDSDHV